MIAEAVQKATTDRFYGRDAPSLEEIIASVGAEFTPEEVAAAEAPWSYVSPPPAENAEATIQQLLAALKLAKDMFIANDISLPRTFEVIDEAIAAAEKEISE